MRLWRISNYATLTGEGGLYAAGRWHSKGRRVVYLADHTASAQLEVLVHLEVDFDDLPDSYQLLPVDIDDDPAVDSLDEKTLPDNWRDTPDVTRAIGDRWIAKNRSLLLKVPSAIVPYASNWLLNPSHSDNTKVRILEPIRVPYDPRLFR